MADELEFNKMLRIVFTVMIIGQIIYLFIIGRFLYVIITYLIIGLGIWVTAHLSQGEISLWKTLVAWLPAVFIKQVRRWLTY